MEKKYELIRPEKNMRVETDWRFYFICQEEPMESSVNRPQKREAFFIALSRS